MSFQGLREELFCDPSAAVLGMHAQSKKVMDGARPDQGVPREILVDGGQKAPPKLDLLAQGVRSQAVLSEGEEVEVSNGFCIVSVSGLKVHHGPGRSGRMAQEKLIVVLHPEVDEAATEQVVDQTIADFDTFFRSLGNGPLVKVEAAIIKTFLGWKLGLAKKKGVGGAPEGAPPVA